MNLEQLKNHKNKTKKFACAIILSVTMSLN